MEKEESNRFAIPYQFLVPQDETLDKPLPPHWSTPMQAYHNSGSTPTPILNPYAAGSYFYPSLWANQACSTPLQYDSLHDPRRLSSYPTAVGSSYPTTAGSSYPIAAGGAAFTFSDKVQRIFSEKSLDSMKICDENSQPISLVTKESRENGNRSSIPKNNWEGVSWRYNCSSAASESKGSPDEGHDANNDFPSTKRQQCNMMLVNGEDAQKVTSIENCNAVHVNRSFASHHFAANSTELNQNLETGLNASGTNPQPEELAGDEIRKERKRQSNRESARRSRMKKQQECEELHKTLGILRDKNSSLKKRLIGLAEECVELTNENDSIEEELVEMYGPESIAKLMDMKPA